MTQLTAPVTGRTHSPRKGQHHAAFWWAAIPLATMGALAIYPLFVLATTTFMGTNVGDGLLSSWITVLSNPAFGTALTNTILIATCSTSICVVLGVFLAGVMYFAPMPGTRVMVNCLAVYLSFPSFLIVLALIFLYGQAGIVQGSLAQITGHTIDTSWLQDKPGVILAEVTYFTPFVIGPVYSALQQMSPVQIEMARSLGASMPRVLWRVVMPEIRPALVAASALLLVRTMNEFGIILFSSAKGVTTLPILIYEQAIARGNLPYAAVIAMVNIAASVLLYSLYLRFTKVREGNRRHG